MPSLQPSRSFLQRLEAQMEFRVDAKGEYYTGHVTKQSIAVVARVQNPIVIGTAHSTLEMFGVIGSDLQVNS